MPQTTITISLTPEVWERAKVKAGGDGRSNSNIGRQIVMEWLVPGVFQKPDERESLGFIFSSRPHKYSVELVQWEYEDQLPEKISAEYFDAMFRASRVDGVRLYPYVIYDGKRIYLGASK